ncbi:MAG TPA: winged helix-turn-helix domain-containing protein [Candidatus Dormibacteraeota bacterium]|jgi:DNA-binding transcriptional ArsR family regulator
MIKPRSHRSATTRLAEEIDGLALDLAWSHWSELGVDGVRRRHDWQAIDLEPLIIFTAYIGNLDSRLRANSIDWCIANARFASAFRLRNLAQQAGPAMREAFGRYAATVKAHAKVPWPAKGDPLALWTSEHIGMPDLRRPSLIQLRLRALVGVSARAEILKLMLAEPDQGYTASAIAEAAGYGKGSVSQAVDLLTMAGIAYVQPTANRLLYRLTRPAELAGALQWLPAAFPDWWPIFKVTQAIAELAHARLSASARVVEAQNVLDRIEPDLRRLAIAEQVPWPTGPASYTEFEHWAITFLADHAGRGEMIPAARDVTYTIHHLSFGGWMGTVSQRGRLPKQLGHDSRSEETTAELTPFDDTAGAAQLAEAMFRDALGRARAAVREAPPGENVTRLISGEFAEELLRSMRPGQEASFTVEFVRRWFENRRHRFGATGS